MKDGLKIVSKTKMKNDWSTNQYQSTKTDYVDCA